MIGVPGISEPPRTSSDSWSSTLRSVNVPATDGVTSHWARVEVQSADSSLAKGGAPAAVVGAPRRKHPPFTLSVKRPAEGSPHAAPPFVGASGGSSATTASMGVVLQPASKSAQITPRGEVFSAIGFGFPEPSMCWRTDASDMSFASLARVAIDVPSSFAARKNVLRGLLALRAHRRARAIDEASA